MHILRDRPFVTQRKIELLSARPLPSALLSTACFFLGGWDRRSDLTKLALIGTMVATFFLFAGKTWLAGGAYTFTQYAQAMVDGSTLPPEIAQRDAGYPLMLVMSGYTLLQSFIPILIVQALFAVLLPLAMYEAMGRLSRPVAFYTSLFGIISLSPYYFMKMIYHDQTYIFFSMLMICLLLIFLQTGHHRMLYFFTAAAIMSSIARPAGNVLFPVFIVVAWLSVRAKARHYAACVCLFAVSIAAYGWHRTVIFDAAHAASTPSYVGQQLFYNPYINTLDYGIRLDPARIGPNLSTVVAQLRMNLQPSVKESPFIRQQIGNFYTEGTPRRFADTNILPFTPDQLVDRIFSNPNWEYYLLLCVADDRLMLNAAWEIARANPEVVITYSVRNLFHFVFDPGYGHTRFNLNPFGPVGLQFVPATHDVAPGDVPYIAPRAVREALFDPTTREPAIMARLFGKVEAYWLAHYRSGLRNVTALMCVAWIAVIVHFCLRFRPRGSPPGPPDTGGRARSFGALERSLVASVIAASLLFGCNAAATAIFAEPDFRYRLSVEPTTILIAGLGVICIERWAMASIVARVPQLARIGAQLASLRSFDPLGKLSAPLLGTLATGVLAAAFGSWAVFMLVNTAD